MQDADWGLRTTYCLSVLKRTLSVDSCVRQTSCCMHFWKGTFHGKSSQSPAQGWHYLAAHDVVPAQMDIAAIGQLRGKKGGGEALQILLRNEGSHVEQLDNAATMLVLDLQESSKRMVNQLYKRSIPDGFDHGDKTMLFMGRCLWLT